MSETVARLNAITRNIDRYESLLSTDLSELEVRYIERRLSEERIKLAALRPGRIATDNVQQIA